MTARPVSALLHGLCYWYFGTAAWAYHLVNLTLFYGSVLFFFLAIKKVISRDIALLSSLFALVYPCASGTIFSSMMMNSNLAAFFWSSALYTTTKDFKGKYILITFLLLYSALSYEAFIPLFLLNMLVIFLIQKKNQAGKRWLVIETLTPLTAIILFIVYRAFIERVIFDTSFSRIQIFSLKEFVSKFVNSLHLGLTITFTDTITISLRALYNLDKTSIYYLIFTLYCLVFLGNYLYKTIKANNLNHVRELSIKQGFPQQQAFFRFNKSHYLVLCVIAVFLFLFAHLIYAFSAYIPNSSGFENRTLGGIRFATALSISIILKSVYEIVTNKTVKRFIAISIIGIFSLFSFSIIGQREAWIAAADYNKKTISEINTAINEHNLDNEKTLTLVAILPSEFPGQINEEPVLGVFWDITPLLSLSNPSITIRANVYNPGTIATPDKITISGYWEAYYPFWLYKYKTKEIYQVTSEQDWYNYVE